MRAIELSRFIVARHAIWIARHDGQPKPWTKDPILRRFKFCNVYRELDTVTQWVARNMRDQLIGNPDLWFAMAVARWVNWPATLRDLGSVVPWNRDKFVRVLQKRRDHDEKVWTGAYMIGTQGNKMDKALFIADHVLSPLWRDRAILRPRDGDTLAAFAGRMATTKNQGQFMVGQIVADAKYEPESILRAASDWSTFAVSGPGSRRGLNRVVGKEKNAHWREYEWHDRLMALMPLVNKFLAASDMKELHAQDLQNCLCEFDKYERVRLGEGRPRSLYAGE